MKTTNKLSASNLFISDGHRVELLRLMPKSAGFVCYLPHSIVSALNLNESDHSLVAFIDDSSSYTTLVIFKDRDLSNLLKTEILSRRQQAEQIQKQLKAHLQAQQQAETEAETAVDV